jgi:hypothetical protein
MFVTRSLMLPCNQVVETSVEASLAWVKQSTQEHEHRVTVSEMLTPTSQQNFKNHLIDR